MGVAGRVKRWGLGLLVGLALAAPAAAEPALWAVRDADSTLYLYGTVHVLKPDTRWQGPGMEKAWGEAQEVWFEVAPSKADDPAVMESLMPLMMDPGRPLSKRLPLDLYAKVTRAAREVGADLAALEPFKPATAAILLASLSMVKAGYSPESGVEKKLEALVGTRPVRELETAEQQVRFLVDLPEDVQLALLDNGLDEIGDNGHLDQVVAAWAKGDTRVLETLYLDELRRDHPKAYAVFVTDRNRAWAQVLAREMAGSGTDFVAVGALHMVGPDGLPALLKARGFTVERVQ